MREMSSFNATSVASSATSFEWMNKEAVRREAEAQLRLDAAVRAYQAALDRRYSIRLSVRVRESVPQVFRQIFQFLSGRGGENG